MVESGQRKGLAEKRGNSFYFKAHDENLPINCQLFTVGLRERERPKNVNKIVVVAIYYHHLHSNSSLLLSTAHLVDQVKTVAIYQFLPAGGPGGEKRHQAKYCGCHPCHSCHNHYHHS